MESYTGTKDKDGGDSETSLTINNETSQETSRDLDTETSRDKGKTFPKGTSSRTKVTQNHLLTSQAELCQLE